MNNGDFFTMSGLAGCRGGFGVAALVIYNSEPYARPGEVPHHRRRQARSNRRHPRLQRVAARLGPGRRQDRGLWHHNCANQGLNIAADLNGTQHLGSVTQTPMALPGRDSQWRIVEKGKLWDQAMWDAPICGEAYLWRRAIYGQGIPVEQCERTLGHSLGQRISVDHQHRRRHDVADVVNPGLSLNIRAGPALTPPDQTRKGHRPHQHGVRGPALN